MDKNKNNNDISADELLRRLKENLELDLSRIELPKEPDILLNDTPSAEDIIAERSRRKAGLEPAEELVIPEIEREPEEEKVLPDLSVTYAEKETAEEIKLPDETHEFTPVSAPAADLPPEEADAALPFDIPPSALEQPEPVVSDLPELIIPGLNSPLATTLEFEAVNEAAVTEEFEAAKEIEPEITPEPEITSEPEKSELSPLTSNTFEFETAAEEPIAALFEEAMNASAEEEPKVITKEIEAQADESEEENAEPISNEQIDQLMRTYLSNSEYDEIAKQREASNDLLRHITEAEEYVSSIEHAKELDEPHEPQSETEKVIKEMDLESGMAGETLDEVDVNLMIAFGMEKELAEKLGEDNAKVVENALDIDAENLNFSRFEKPESTELPDDMEFISQNQIKDVFKVYRRKQRNLIIRFFGAAIMTLLLFIFENITVFGGSFEGTALDPSVFPVVHSMVSLQLCFFVLAFACKTVLSGFKSLFSFKPTAKSALALVAMFTVIYHVAFCFLYDGGDVVFCTFPLALGVLVTIISDYMSLKRDIYSFNIVASKRIKYFISEIGEGEESLERSTFAEYIDEDSNVSRVSKASFIDGFFHRTKESTRPVPVLRAILPLPVAIAIFFFIFSTFVRNDPYLGLTSAYISLMLSTPITLMLVTAIPFYRASKIAYEQGGAIIGEDSLEEYSDVAAISFDDKDVFPSGGVKIRSIKVYNNNRIDRVIYNVASLFKHVGGPLADVYSIATKDFECSDDVEIMDIQEDGIEAVISGKHIFLGRESFLIRNNFTPALDQEDRRIESNSCTSITFLVTNDEVAAKIYTSYSIDPGFASIAKQLYRAGMCLGIKTFDPGIDDTLLGRFINLAKYPVKIIKCRSMADKLATEEKADSGIVSKKSARSLLKALSLCEKVNSCAKTGTFVAMLSVIIGFAISAFLLFQGLSGSVNGIYVALYQLFWLIPTVIISQLNVNR
ncbi:MAG: hypothetical protein IJC50_05080 [Clostridia bacterium]|nr:hypothetical protein [Clostridia bacterium]